MVGARRVRGDRKVQNIGKRFCSCAWPARVLVNRGEHNSFIVRYQCLGAVAMMRVKVPDRDPPNLLCRRGRWPRSRVSDANASKSIQGGHCNVAEITKPHRAITRGMVTGRSHQTECAFSADRCACCFNRGPRCLPGIEIDLGIGWSVEIEILARLRYPREMLVRAGAQQFLIEGRARTVPLPVTVPTL